ncbi:monovalent cation/H+ antiporter complex subunit F [Marinobacter pelagius]|uniref:Multicomponent Na+:H+ antiporter subunit F n=1 Tax=Marinobacter pelagius TaxID=379482 RepID=A0A1I4ZL75_9GAMM|nr:monovalent cation/H+ antiporter complex subunit F [Marinobacter pelagius]SFN50968.1 multicomponent Na+:H+ antiporter subunit F [Marinobacter pelagius]
MTVVLLGVAAFLLLTLLLALIRIWRGPEAADRMLASQLFGTTGVALLLVLAYAHSWPALMDVALILAVLSVLAVAAFVTRVVRIDREDTAEESGNAESREEPHV